MSASLLVVTPHTAFGKSLRQSLGTSSCRVYVAKEAEPAIRLLKENQISLAFLDTALSEEAALEIGKMLRTLNPRLELVILSPGEEPDTFEDLRPYTYLRKPVTTQSLYNAVASVCPRKAVKTREIPPEVATEEETEEDAAQTPPPWLDDAAHAAQHLTRLTLESSAQATLIVREGALWAYAGQLSQPAAQELASTIQAQKKEGDLLRFIHLQSTQADHMLYATRLGENISLAMVFDAETPFSTIRSQATHLADSLSLEKKAAKPNVETLEDVDLPPIDEILADLPAPDPKAPEAAPSASPAIAETKISEVEEKKAVFSQESSPAIPLEDFISTDKLRAVNAAKAKAAPQTIQYELDETLPSKPKRPLTPVRPPAEGELDETIPHSITEVASRTLLESTSPGLYNITYACLLLPRFDSHHITGDLAENLSRWMPQICIAFGWRLEYLAVRPDYLQWVINVPPNTSPGYLMRIIRQQTSKRIFENFPRIKKENPSGDFWAPGYLIMGSAQPHPSKLVQEYIQRTRKRQGIHQK